MRRALVAYVIWDPGATTDMASIAAVLAIDQELRKRTKGKLYGRWYQPKWTRSFRVANGEVIPATYEVEFVIPLRRNGRNQDLVFRVAAIDPGPDPKNHVPWLLSNETGMMIGANFSSRKGIVTCEDKKLFGWKIKCKKSRSGHWLFPLVQAFCDLGVKGKFGGNSGTAEKLAQPALNSPFVGHTKVADPSRATQPDDEAHRDEGHSAEDRLDQSEDAEPSEEPAEEVESTGDSQVNLKGCGNIQHSEQGSKD